MSLKNKILITGSKGLIGHAVKDQLKNRRLKVQGIDIDYPATHSEHGDIRDAQLIKNLAAECSGIVHLAAVSRVILGERNPQLCWDINVNGTCNLLQALHDLPDKPWIIYASSREVYGQQTELPVREEATLSPINAYAHSKVAAEKLVMGYRKRGLQTAIVRFSNVYGSVHDHVDRVIPAFCRVAALGGMIRIDGSHNTFDFTHINDVVTGIVKVVDQLQAGCMDFPTVHFTTGEGVTLRQAAELAKRFSQHSVKFLEAPSRIFDISSFYGDPTLASQRLGWEAKVRLQDGMAQLIHQFKRHAELIAVNHNQCDENIEDYPRLPASLQRRL